MKKHFFPGVIFLLITVSCARQENKYPFGAWQLVQSQSIENGKARITYPGILDGSEFKMWSEKNFMFVGRWKQDSVITDNYGYGTYTLDGTAYEETVIYHFSKNYENQNIKMTLEFKNDTLIQVYHPVDSSGMPTENISSVEKYVRMK